MRADRACHIELFAELVEQSRCQRLLRQIIQHAVKVFTPHGGSWTSPSCSRYCVSEPDQPWPKQPRGLRSQILVPQDPIRCIVNEEAGDARHSSKGRSQP
jgi:hypothetical protein